jgi:YD repeat-containing protein
MISPNGSRTDYTYDARGREVARSTVVNGIQQITTSTYDAFGRLAKVQDPDGHYRAYQYDVAGRIRYEWEPEVGGTFAQRVYTYNDMSLPTTIKTRRVSTEPSMGTVP